jgi:hypothetical protein
MELARGAAAESSVIRCRYESFWRVSDESGRLEPGDDRYILAALLWRRAFRWRDCGSRGLLPNARVAPR